ncbi:hypothetical protein [Microbacterium sp.]|uniref:hypothetical protein n=1 Tax=Microbacterium sp. TaxID=51671 RepID=UPI0039E5CCEA
MTGTEHPVPADLAALHGRTVEVEQVDVIADNEGIPSWIKVERELAGVVIVPSLLQPPAAPERQPIPTATTREKATS